MWWKIWPRGRSAGVAQVRVPVLSAHVSTVPASSQPRIAHSGVPRPGGVRPAAGRSSRAAPEVMRGRVSAGVALAAALRRAGGCDAAGARASLSSLAAAQAAAPSEGASQPQAAPQAPRRASRAAVSLAAAALALAAAAKADALPRPAREAADAAAAAAALARAVWTDAAAAAAADGAAGARCLPAPRAQRHRLTRRAPPGAPRFLFATGARLRFVPAAVARLLAEMAADAGRRDALTSAADGAVVDWCVVCARAVRLQKRALSHAPQAAALRGRG